MVDELGVYEPVKTCSNEWCGCSECGVEGDGGGVAAVDHDVALPVEAAKDALSDASDVAQLLVWRVQDGFHALGGGNISRRMECEWCPNGQRAGDD
jgi:hypothetical protein